MTRIRYERSGGAVGRELQLTLDLDELDKDKAQNLKRLIDESNFFALPENLRGSATSREFQYTITIERDHDSHTVRASDTTMPRSLFALVRELTLLNMLTLD